MNKKIGNATEKKVIEMLAKNGYWCHLFGYKAEGQPCDIIALKNNKSVLIDVKHCISDRFDFVRIESNQRNCFTLATSRGNSNCGFVIYFEKSDKWKWLSMQEVFYNEIAMKRKSISCDELGDFENEVINKK